MLLPTERTASSVAFFFAAGSSDFMLLDLDAIGFDLGTAETDFAATADFGWDSAGAFELLSISSILCRFLA